MYHLAKLVQDEKSEVWWDNDDDPDSARIRREFPEGYIWRCCKTNGAALYKHENLGPNLHPDEEDEEERRLRLGKGCKFGRHYAPSEEAPRPKKRIRMEGKVPVYLRMSPPKAVKRRRPN